jgi:hypothetical protein
MAFYFIEVENVMKIWVALGHRSNYQDYRLSIYVMYVIGPLT